MKKEFTYILVIAVFLSVMIPRQTRAQMVVAETGGNLFTNIVTTLETVWGTIAEEVLEPAVKSLANKLLDKVVNQSLNWAVGGFDEEPGFINDYGDLIKGTKYNEIINWYDKSSKNSGVGQQTGNPGQIAQQNYSLQNSENFNLKRSATRAIALYGKENLGKSNLAKTINLENETISKFLGGDSGVKNFKKDFNEGGWGAYLEILNPNNTTIGINSLVKSGIQKETEEKIEEKINDLQTPQKFLDKSKCLEYEVNETTGKQVCIKKETITPGEQVSEKINKALVKDENQAEQADGLIATLIKSAVGKITNSLVSNGLSSLGGGTNSSFYNQSSDIFNNGSIDAQFGFNPTGTNDGFNDNSTPQLGFNSSGNNSQYIGGPEDALDYGQGGAQLIIDLESELEQMIELNQVESSYYEEIKNARKESKDDLIALDQCIPGPDLGWETRFQDIEILEMKQEGKDVTQQIKKLSFAETKEMVNDSRVNIPGSNVMRENITSVLSSSKQSAQRDLQRIQALDKTRTSLISIHDEILFDFNIQKQGKNPNLVIFSKNWEFLTQNQKVSAFQYAVDNQFATLAPGETVTSVVSTNPEKAKNAVIKVSWKIWTQETSKEKKTDLRYSYFVIQNSLSNEESIARTKSEANLVKGNALKMKQYLRDCLVFKAYALGVSVQSLQNSLSQGGSNISSINSQLSQINNMISGPSGILGGGFGSVGGPIGGILGGIFGGSSGPTISYINTSNARSDELIKGFVLEEKLKQQNNQPSVFSSNVITSNISNSILGFNSSIEKAAYINNNYPLVPKSPISVPQDVVSIYKADTLRYRGKIRGVLYCRNQGSTLVAPLLIESACYSSWYKATGLDYAVALSGI